MPTKRSVHAPQVAEPPPQTWSNCVVLGDQVFIAGMTAASIGEVGSPDMYEQAKAVFNKIKYLIEAAGGEMNDIVKGQHLRDRHRSARRGLESPSGVLQGRLSCLDAC